MKEIQILFSPPMVKALLDGSKTQTRRTMNVSAHSQAKGFDGLQIGRGGKNDTALYARFDNDVVKCPYGTIGDVLAVRETFYTYGEWVKNGKTKSGKQAWKFVDWIEDGKSDFEYRYFDNPPQRVLKNSERKAGWYKRPSLFMPREVCRIKLEIIGIRAERLHDISESDAIAEGIENDGIPFPLHYKDYLNYKDKRPRFYKNPIESYFSLWEKINGKESLDSNPWVWVVEFKRKIELN